MNLTNDEILKYVLENGILNMDTIQEQMNMKRRKDILAKHPYKIWLGNDGYWHTHIPEKAINGRNKAVKKKTEKDMQDFLVKYWSQQNTDSFKERWKIWVNRQEKLGRSDNTIYKYECDYKRFINGDKLENMDVRDITCDDINFYFVRLLDKENVTYKALKLLYGYINGVFEKSIIDGIIEKNPCIRVDLPMFKKKCVEPRKKTAKERTISESEKKILLNKMVNTTSMARFAVELSFYTGMRVGELSALRWTDIDYMNGVINIERSEKRSKKTKEYFIDTTKTGKARQIPLTDAMKDVLKRTKAEEVKNGFLSDYIFCNENGRIHASVISNYMRNNTMSEEFSSVKSIHAIRRTLNSNMKCMGVSTTVAASILGHTERVNEENYTYDIASMSEKKRYIELAGKIC